LVFICSLRSTVFHYFNFNHIADVIFKVRSGGQRLFVVKGALLVNFERDFIACSTFHFRVTDLVEDVRINEVFSWLPQEWVKLEEAVKDFADLLVCELELEVETYRILRHDPLIDVVELLYSCDEAHILLGKAA